MFITAEKEKSKKAFKDIGYFDIIYFNNLFFLFVSLIKRGNENCLWEIFRMCLLLLVLWVVDGMGFNSIAPNVMDFVVGFENYSIEVYTLHCCSRPCN